MLSISYGVGVRAAEVCNLKVGDIDSGRMLIHVEQGKGAQGPQGHPVSRPAGAAAGLLARGPARGLAVPGKPKIGDAAQALLGDG